MPPGPWHPRVLTISLHEHPVTLWPGTGLPAGTTDAGWLRAFHALVPPLLREFRWAARGAKFRAAARVPQGGPGCETPR